MSRPIYEPSLPRADAENSYGNRQLFRRPAPASGEGAMDSAYLLWDNGATIAGDGNFENLDEYSDGVSGQYIDAVLDEGGFVIWATGIYLVSLVTLWSDSFVGGKGATIQSAAGQILQDTLYWETWVSEQNTDTFVDMVTLQALFFVTNATGSQPTIRASVAQNSGSPEDLSSADFSIVRLSEYVQMSS